MHNNNTAKTVCTVALVGCGVVGGGTARLLLDDSQVIQKRNGVELSLKYVVDRNFDTARRLKIPSELYCTEFQTVLSDPEVDVVIELVGGLGFAREVIKKALDAGKHVVSANKALLAHHGKELFALAHEKDRAVAFEASCGGGIPIVRALYDGLSANRIEALYGIVNGTCNFILSEMIQKHKSYTDALKDAQAAGFAEADPSLDVQGTDSAHKITILSSLAFGRSVSLDDVMVKGIDTLKSADLEAGGEMGYVTKLIAQAQNTADGLFVRVEPAFISRNHPLAWVSGSFNAVSVYGHAVGHTLYYGRGAGSLPTASAVVSDIISIANGTYPSLFRSLGIWPDRSETARILAQKEIVRRYYMRFLVDDKPGILAQLTAILGKLGISVASIHQPENKASSGFLSGIDAGNESANGAAGSVTQSSAPTVPVVPIIILVHPTSDERAVEATRQILGLSEVKPDSALIPVLDEHPEYGA